VAFGSHLQAYFDAIYIKARTAGEPDMVNLLDVEVWGSGIIVTLPGTNYWVTYFKEKESPGLFPADIANKDDPRVTMTAAEFLAKAWKLANERARELGWVT